jgi:hypothetical protein
VPFVIFVIFVLKPSAREAYSERSATRGSTAIARRAGT